MHTGETTETEYPSDFQQTQNNDDKSSSSDSSDNNNNINEFILI